MSHFACIDTEAPPPAGPNGTEGTLPLKEIKENGTYTSEAIQSDFAEWISGAAYSEKEGILEIQQSFDFPQDHEILANAEAKATWTLSKEGKITVKAGVSNGQTFQIFAGAPYFRFVWTQGTEATKKIRIFMRAHEMGRI